jgi:methyltransferase family protein
MAMPRGYSRITTFGRYIATGMTKIEGWLHPHAAELIAAISEIQKQEGISGAIGEIGVHHGRLFILLLLTAAPGERAFAIDVFEHQELNVDGSGYGNREVLLRNVRDFCGRDKDVLIIANSSLDLSPDEIVDQVGQVRLMSIDGGHTAECTTNDLQLAGAMVHDRGVVILDDYFNSSWPDVATGAAEYFLRPESKLKPFAIGPNKLFISAPSNHDLYRKELRARFSSYKTSRMFQMEVDLYGSDTAALTPGQHFRLGIKESALGPYAITANALLRRVMNRLAR